MGVAETHDHELIGYADGVAGNSISRRANALSFTAVLFSANAERGFGTPLSVAERDPGAFTTRVSFLFEEHPHE